MYNFLSFLIIGYIIYLILNINTIENFRRKGIKMPSIKNIGKSIKNVAKKAGDGIKKVAKKAGSAILTIIPIPKQSYVPKTYAKASYGIGVGKIPIQIIMRPLKPGIKISKI